MQARICDRCGHVYSRHFDKTPDGKVTLEFNVSSSDAAPFCAFSEDKTYDLCPSCCRDFISKFMKQEGINNGSGI